MKSIVLFSLIFLTGCAGRNVWTWRTEPGAIPKADLDEAKKICEKKTTMTLGKVPSNDFDMDYYDRRKDFMNDCMKGYGYILIHEIIDD